MSSSFIISVTSVGERGGLRQRRNFPWGNINAQGCRRARVELRSPKIPKANAIRSVQDIFLCLWFLSLRVVVVAAVVVLVVVR